MAVISWTGVDGRQFWVDIASPISITATSATTTITLPPINLKAYSAYWGSGNRLLGLCCDYDFYYNSWSGDWHTDCVEIKNGSTIIKNNLYAHTNSYVGNNVYGSAVWNTSPTINTNTLFSSTNKGEKTVSLGLYLPNGAMSTYSRSESGSAIYTEQEYKLSTINVTLNVPPTATLGTPTYATPHYAGLGAYTVPITSAEAYYGGDIAKVTLTVGQDSTVQTYSSASISSETISVTPTIAGTYTPTITVEDSRGQTYTETLSQITVNPYLAPSLDFDVVRTNNNGVRDDEGAYGLLTANVSFTDAVANLRQPTVKINDNTTNNVTWYSAYSSSTGISSAISDWSTVSSGDTIYGLINGSFAQTDSYQITVVLTDSLGGNSSAITQTLSTAFYTIDFQAGGKEIAFGTPANDDINNYPDGLFKCKMNFIDMKMIGEIKMYAGSTIPIGWLLCDGSEVLIDDYPLLYAAIGNTWGTPSDNDHFILPNMKGKVPVGYDGNDTDFSTVGNNGGTKDAVVPYHRHSVSAVNNAITGGSHCHRLPGNDKTVASGSSYARPRSDGAGTANMYYTTYDTHTHNLPAHNTDYIGTDGNAVGANLQPYAVVKYIICAA